MFQKQPTEWDKVRQQFVLLLRPAANQKPLRTQKKNRNVFSHKRQTAYFIQTLKQKVEADEGYCELTWKTTTSTAAASKSLQFESLLFFLILFIFFFLYFPKITENPILQYEKHELKPSEMLCFDEVTGDDCRAGTSEPPAEAGLKVTVHASTPRPTSASTNQELVFPVSAPACQAAHKGEGGSSASHAVMMQPLMHGPQTQSEKLKCD